MPPYRHRAANLFGSFETGPSKYFWSCASKHLNSAAKQSKSERREQGPDFPAERTKPQAVNRAAKTLVQLRYNGTGAHIPFRHSLCHGGTKVK